MRTTTSIMITGALLLSAACGKENQKTQASQVPEPVRKTFEATHGTVKEMTWEQEGDHYAAEFKVNGVEHEVIYSADGSMVASSMEIGVGQLPAAVPAAVAAAFPGSTITEAEEITSGSSTTYEVEMTSGGQQYELVLGADGGMISQEIEAEEAGDDEEE